VSVHNERWWRVFVDTDDRHQLIRFFVVHVPRVYQHGKVRSKRMRVNTVNGLIDGVSVGDHDRPHLSSSGKSQKPDLSRVEIPFLRVGAYPSHRPLRILQRPFPRWFTGVAGKSRAVVEDKTGNPQLAKPLSCFRTFQIRYHLTETTSGQNQNSCSICISSGWIDMHRWSPDFFNTQDGRFVDRSHR